MLLPERSLLLPRAIFSSIMSELEEVLSSRLPKSWSLKRVWSRLDSGCVADLANISFSWGISSKSSSDSSLFSSILADDRTSVRVCWTIFMSSLSFYSSWSSSSDGFWLMTVSKDLISWGLLNLLGLLTFFELDLLPLVSICITIWVHAGEWISSSYSTFTAIQKWPVWQGRLRDFHERTLITRFFSLIFIWLWIGAIKCWCLTVSALCWIC